MSIVLLGMPGVGKTTIGQHIARSLNLPFVDTDAHIYAQLKMSPDRIISQHGLNYFRNLEVKSLASIIQQPNVVCAIGGGTIVTAQARNLLNSFSLKVYLHISVNSLYQRYQSNASMLYQRTAVLATCNLKLKLQDLFRQRYKLYRDCANLTICHDKCTIQATASKIIKNYINVSTTMPL